MEHAFIYLIDRSDTCFLLPGQVELIINGAFTHRDLKRVWKRMTSERSSSSHKPGGAVVARCCFCADTRGCRGGTEGAGPSDVACHLWPSRQLVQQEGREVLCILCRFWFVLSLVSNHRTLLSAVCVWLSGETKVGMNSF